jgi:hypothetical protein
MSNDGTQGMSKADRVLGRTPGSDDGSREFHSDFHRTPKAERMLGIGQYDLLYVYVYVYVCRKRHKKKFR